MVWGEEAPIKPGFPVLECVAGLGLICLVGVIASDPIGRAAVHSYEAATQKFIDDRDAASSFVSTNFDGSKDLDAPPSRSTSAYGLNPASLSFEDYGSISSPPIDVTDLSVNVGTLNSTEFEAPNIEVRTAETGPVEPLRIEQMPQQMRLLVDNRDSTLLERSFCTDYDRLSGLCGANDFTGFLEKTD